MSSMVRTSLIALLFAPLLSASAAAPALGDVPVETQWDIARASQLANGPGQMVNALQRWEMLTSSPRFTSGDYSGFVLSYPGLPDEAKMRLDQVVTSLKTDPKLVYIEIEGHTDNVGSPEMNERLGLDRAESVKRYLYAQHQVPLHKISVISYGEDKPVAPNNAKEGRAQNRRVVVRVLS